MKLFITLLLLSTPLYAKNKVLFTNCVNCTPESKEEPLYDLYIMSDFKKQFVKRTLESRGKFYFGSCEDYVVYINNNEKTRPLFIVTDFTSYAKTKITDDAISFDIKNGILYFEKLEGLPDKPVKVLYAITDFKTLAKQEVNRGYSEKILDQY